MAAEVHQVVKDISEAERRNLITEADRQTQAVMRLEVYKRLGYTGVAAAALLIYWQVYLSGPEWFLGLGIALLVIFGIAALILTVGIANAKKNIKAIVAAAGIDLDSMPLGNGKDSKFAQMVRRANTKAEGFLSKHSNELDGE